jgi:hypothetical protein
MKNLIRGARLGFSLSAEHWKVYSSLTFCGGYVPRPPAKNEIQQIIDSPFPQKTMFHYTVKPVKLTTFIS